MKIYKKYNTLKNKPYNEIAKKYLIKNNIKCYYYAFIGMNANIDYIKADNKILKFENNL